MSSREYLVERESSTSIVLLLYLTDIIFEYAWLILTVLLFLIILSNFGASICCGAGEYNDFWIYVPYNFLIF